MCGKPSLLHSQHGHPRDIIWKTYPYPMVYTHVFFIHSFKVSSTICLPWNFPTKAFPIKSITSCTPRYPPTTIWILDSFFLIILLLFLDFLSSWIPTPFSLVFLSLLKSSKSKLDPVNLTPLARSLGETSYNFGASLINWDEVNPHPRTLYPKRLMRPLDS